ncbi:hypothetical protein ABRY23_14370, partial [Melioribacteraceae bacterium 4301-Me]|uniref:hypothetical protein n=1 Tax=Pyranulibacter aquaticus TaxID=3163344 RepID=UPI00359A6648
MKTIRILTVLFFLVINFYNITFAQEEYSSNFIAAKNIQRYSQLGTTYYSSGPQEHYYAGLQDDEPGDANMFRLKVAYDLSSIPSNAVIQSAELTLQGRYTSNFPSEYTQTWVYIKKYEYSFNEISETVWQIMDTSKTLFSTAIPRTVYNFNTVQEFTSDSDLSKYVKSKLGGSLYLAIMSDESFYTGYSANVLDFYNGQVKLKIIYTVPPSVVTITADNNFTDNSGQGTHGSIKVDDSIIYTAPFPFQRNTGTNVTLEAVSPQTDNLGYQEVWHTGSYNPSEWRRNGIFRSNDNPYSFTVSSDDNNKTHQAQFRQLRFTTSGTLSEDETWCANVTLTGNVTVPSGITLTVTSDVTVNFNGYGILLYGGTVNFQGGDPNCVYLKQSGSLKGYFG